MILYLIEYTNLLKKFFITYPKLNYVNDSSEKNHFLRLKTKEKLTGNTHLLSNMNLSSK